LIDELIRMKLFVVEMRDSVAMLAWDFAAELLLKAAETGRGRHRSGNGADGARLACRRMVVMPREGAIIFRDLVGKLDMLNVECAKCGRRGRYHHPLIERYGIDAKLFDRTDEITADCLRKQAKNFKRSMRRSMPGLAEGGLIVGNDPTGAKEVRSDRHFHPRGNYIRVSMMIGLIRDTDRANSSTRLDLQSIRCCRLPSRHL
jgi:hypothetical protein